MNNLKNENGYVLVVIIGILTILSLMTITFATLSRIETRATRNYTDSVKCEKIAKAALEYAIYEIWQDKFGDDGEAYNDDNGDENYDEEGDASWPGESIFPDTGTDDYDNDKDVSSTDDSTWIYFPATDSSSDIRLPGNLRARYAVLITDDREARVNVNVTGNQSGGGAHTANEGWSTFEIDLSNIIKLASTGNGTATANSIIDARLGSDDAPGTSTPTNDDSGIVPDPQSDNIDNDGDWVTGNDTNGNGIPDAGETGVDDGDNSESIDEPNEFNSVFPHGDDIPFGILSEAEIMGTTSYTSRLETIFNTSGISASEQGSLNSWVTTCSADTILCPSYQLDGGTSTTMLNINALVNNEGAYTNSGTYDSDKKVEMIIDVLTEGGVPDVERQQIAVNIIDSIDSDDTVTKYPESLIPTPVYYGVERTPYINEVEAEVKASTSSGNGKFIELFNPYDTDISLASWTITGATMPQIPLSGTIGSQTYYVISDNALAYQTDFDYEGGGTAADLYDANVNILTTTGETLTLSDDNGNSVQVTDYGNTTGGDSKTQQLNDPRPIPLTASASEPWEWSSGNETAGEENLANIFDPGAGSDGWSDTTWKPSFLVANRRFSNIGYLGFIHNGSEWSSFLLDSSITYPNVLQYITVTDPSMDNIDNDGDGSVDSADIGSQSGDFDGQEHRIPGMINVNTASVEVLESLPDITNAIATAIQGDNQKPFSSIGNLLEDVPDITNTGSTKWDKEKPFRSISNLITTRSNVFTVYVTAQVIDDAISTVYAEKRILAIVDRSVDPIKVRYFRWLVE
jgi:hypothetical protein